MEKLFDLAIKARERALDEGREPKRWNVRSDALAQLAREASEHGQWDRGTSDMMFGIPVIDVGPSAKRAVELVSISFPE